MKFLLQADILKNKLGYINHGVSNKSQLPILLHILLEAKNNKVTLSSTDLEIGIQTELPAKVEAEGSCAIPAKNFSELISSLYAKEVTFTLQGNMLHVTTEKTKTTFSTMPHQDFPKLYEEKGLLLAQIKSGELKKELQPVIFSASSDTARPALSGILMEQEKNGFLLVATDGFRLSLKHYGANPDDKLQVLEGEQRMIVPARVFKELLSLKEDSGKVSIFIAKEQNQIVFEQNQTLLIGRLISQEYPNYERIIPGDFSVRASFDREEMLNAVRICSIFARDTANIIKLSIREDKIIVSAGENIVEVDAIVKGEENEIAFNARYLLELLTNIPADTLQFEMIGPLNPGVYKVNEDQSFLHLIMPIKIQQ